MPGKSSDLDPIPSSLIKNNMAILLPTIVTIFQSGTFPLELKSKPLLEKAHFNSREFNNYRPVSNMAFLGKIIEKVVAARIIEYIYTHQLSEQMQSAYRQGHSTETALLRVQNDILCALDRKQWALLVLLDFSAAFDTIDHTLLLDRLSARFGISGTAHSVDTLLPDRSQSGSMTVALNFIHFSSVCLKAPPWGPYCSPCTTQDLTATTSAHMVCAITSSLMTTQSSLMSMEWMMLWLASRLVLQKSAGG